jgi:excisionase family DNA binding protein
MPCMGTTSKKAETPKSLDMSAVEVAEHIGISPPAKPVGVSVVKVAEHIGVSPAVIYRAISRGDLKALRVGKRYLLSRVVVDQLLKSAGMPVGEIGL